jgi:hypothetical protein
MRAVSRQYTRELQQGCWILYLIYIIECFRGAGFQLHNLLHVESSCA